MEKTKSTMEEKKFEYKAERMTTRDESKKEMATEKKDDMNTAAEFNNKEAKDQNGAARHEAQGYSTTGETEYDPAIGGGGPVPFDHPTAKTQDPSFPC